MYVPGYVGGVNINGAASGTNLCLPQYLAFNPLQHQYSLMTSNISPSQTQNFSSSSFVTTSSSAPATTTSSTPPQQQQQSQTAEEQPKQTIDSSESCGLTSSSNPTSSMIEEVNTQYLTELRAEKEELEKKPGENTNAIKLLHNEIQRIENGVEGYDSDPGGYREPIKYFDIYRERPVRLTVRALVPVKEHPKFNFVGKLLGPKGNSMKRLQEETMTKMAVLGRGSMRDKQKEEELRASQDPKYQHLQEELHVEITAFAPPAEAHARIAFALTEVRKYLIPDSNDEIRQEQMRELEMISVNGESVLDSLKQQSQAAQLLLTPGSLAGLTPGSLPFQQTPVTSSPHLSTLLPGVQATNNAFVTSPFQPSNTGTPAPPLLQIPGSVDTER